MPTTEKPSPSPRYCAECGERVFRDTRIQSFFEKMSEPRAIWHLKCYIKGTFR